MLGHFQQPVKPCSVTPHFRALAACATLALLPVIGPRAQQTPPLSGAWIQCEADELAGEIVPFDPSAPVPGEAPIQAEAGRVESSPTQSVLEGDVRLTRGGQKLRADRLTLERPGNVARIESPFLYGDSRQALRGKRAEVDLNTRTAWFKDVDYYLPERNAQGSAEEVRLDRNTQRGRLEDATYSTCARGREIWQLRAHDMTLDGANASPAVPAGVQLKSYSIGPDGVITGVYDDGISRGLGQLALADFNNPMGLEKVGETAFRESQSSGTPQLDVAGQGRRGTLMVGSLEMSNVDLAAEFTNLILAQRGFQASSRVITTSDQVLEDLVNIKR